MGATFGAPVVAFEAPAEKMASRRLHLPSPVRLSNANFVSFNLPNATQPSLHHITHVYNNADVRFSPLVPPFITNFSPIL